MDFYTYGNIVRIVDINKTHPENSRMIDVNMDEKTILSNFDASRPFDAAFIKSFLDIIALSSTGFRVLSDIVIQEKAMEISKIQ